MLRTLHPTALGRLLMPQRGARANARDALSLHTASREDRRQVAVAQARVHGTASWTPLRDAAPEGAHAVHFPEHDAVLVARLAAFVGEGLAAGEVCLVLGTPSHRAGLRRRLALSGLDEAAAELLVERDAAEVLQSVLCDGCPDPDRFEVVVGGLVRQARARGTGVRAFGELVGLLAARDDLVGALRLEQLWEELLRRTPLPLLCAYPGLSDPAARAQVCRRHTHLAASAD